MQSVNYSEEDFRRFSVQLGMSEQIVMPKTLKEFGEKNCEAMWARMQKQPIEEELFDCSICSCDFNPEEEGGVVGDIGILPMALCPTCFNGMLDMADQYRIDECIHCGKNPFDEEDC
tara:strand:- start:359 stop:709 length:351 start_codon:yes stop_codon:yes gene_type:complete